MAKLFVKSWETFQHYKRRNPPWIRLYRNLLDNYEFACLPLASKALAPQLWLLASESMDGSIEFNMQKLAFRLRVDIDLLAHAITHLISHGFFQPDDDASAMLAERLRDATPETETETETEAESEILAKGVLGDSVSVHGERIDPITGEVIPLARRTA